MKKFSKILSVALLVALVLSLGVANAFAAGENETVTITVSRDSSYQTGAEGNRDLYAIKIFDATYASHTATGPNASTDPDSITDNPENGVSYSLTATDPLVAKLGTWDTETKTWSKATGNEWIKLTPSIDGAVYIVEWDGAQTAEAMQKAASWLAQQRGGEGTKLTYNSETNKWSANVTKGYYVIKSSEGENLVAATTNIDVKEKNTYPKIDKQQKKANGDWTPDPLPKEIGTYIDYKITVDVPNDANKPIAVVDKMSTGLSWNTEYTVDGYTPVVNGLVVEFAEGVTTKTFRATTAADTNYFDAGEDVTWQIIFPEDTVIANQGKSIVIYCQALITKAALQETGRENDVTLNYNEKHYTMPDHVEYEIGAAAVIKYDGATAELKNGLLTGDNIKYLNATFTLTDAAGKAVNVSLQPGFEKGVYVVDNTSSSNAVTSDKAHDGLILIYGLEPGAKYYLTETATESGYNPLTAPFEIATVVKAKVNSDNSIKVVVKDKDTVIPDVYAGAQSADAKNTLTITPDEIGYIANNTGSVLPSTGGIGTTIFYVVGGVLVLAAIILLVTKKRMSE